MPPAKSIGLFIGAGASYELGMPLVWHVTAELRGYLTPEHFRELNAGWRSQGGGYASSVIEDAIVSLHTLDVHYEGFLAHLQQRSMEPSESHAEDYRGVYGRIVEIVSLLLLPRQVGSLPYIKLGLPPFEGLSHFVKESSPLWVFSLNHDLMFHLIARQCKLPLRDGFWPHKTLRIASNKPGKPCASLTAEVLTEQDLEANHLYLFAPGETGINLLRLHGALDMFTFRDGLDLCRLSPTNDDLDGYLTALKTVNDDIGYWDADGKVRFINEIGFVDDINVLQFLRRSLLAGDQKFTRRFSQTLPQAMLEIFRSQIIYVTELYVIGYSFGDAHTDKVMQEWLEADDARSMVLVDPRRTDVPPTLSHLVSRIQLRQQGAGDFFASYRDHPMTSLEAQALAVRAALRPGVERRAAIKW